MNENDNTINKNLTWTCYNNCETYYTTSQNLQILSSSFEELNTISTSTNNINEKTKIINHNNDNKKILNNSFKTLVVNLFAGPGAGKSTVAAGIFYELKNVGINCEIVSEYAKDLIWEERYQTLNNQLYIFSKQHHHISRLNGKVKVIITDSPLLLSIVYDKEKRETFEKLIIEEHNKFWNYNVFINRKKPFNSCGRIHNEIESKKIDSIIYNMLLKHKIEFDIFEDIIERRNAIIQKILYLIK